MVEPAEEETEIISEKLSDLETTPSIAPEGISYKDFLPEVDSDRTTCFQKRYGTFSETVEKANDWLAHHEGCEVVACESLPFERSGSNNNQLADSWPNTTHLRGLRVWVRAGNVDDMMTKKERTLLSYRDFIPRFNNKSMLKKRYEDVNVLLDRINSYLADRTTAARVLSLQTLDTPMDGLLEEGADTERSRLTFPQHGYTRYCRSLRLFSVTKYVRGHSTPPQPQPRLGIKDFTVSDFSSFRTSELMQKAIKWCKAEQVSIMNMQVLSQRTGQQSSASAWMLESPGHIPNKFTAFVRIVYIISSEKTPVEMNGDTKVDKSNEDENENMETMETVDVGNVPGVINTAPQEEEVPTSDTFDDVHCKIFAPRLVSSGSWCGGDEFESLDQITLRLNSWASASQGDIVTVHTQYLYYTGDEIDGDETHWLRYMTGCQQIGIVHVLVSGGRPPTAIPIHPPSSDRSSCALM